MQKALLDMNEVPVVPLRPVYIVWKDHSKEDGVSFRKESPTPVILHGITQLVEETDDAYVVAHFVGSQEFCVFDRTAILKTDVVGIINLIEISGDTLRTLLTRL